MRLQRYLSVELRLGQAVRSRFLQSEFALVVVSRQRLTDFSELEELSFYTVSKLAYYLSSVSKITSQVSAFSPMFGL